jgi:hypothetical protein
MGLDTFLSLVLQLATGILAVQDPARPVATDEALSWAAAAAYHARAAGVDPWELVGIARNESDFEPTKVGPDGKDCGIAQTRVTYSKYRCKQLREDASLSFEEAARELRENQARCLKHSKGDVVRCRINSYNSGVHYARQGWAGGYWLRVQCFADAAKAGVHPWADCRRVQSRGDIARLIKQSQATEMAYNSLILSVPPSQARIVMRVASSR